MPGYTLVPVDYLPDFEGVSFVPVDYDPFAGDGPIQQAGTQLASQLQPLANGSGQPNVAAPADNAQAAAAGARTAIIDASPEHPLRVTVTDDGKLTISPP